MFERKTRSHFKYENGSLVPKKYFQTEDEALNFARYINIQPATRYKLVCYKCSECNGWHVGHNGSELSIKDKENAQKKLIEYKKIQQILKKR